MKIVLCNQFFHLGVVDIFLDRRLTRDDNRGLAQGVTDNREISSSFKLLFEPRRTVGDSHLQRPTKILFPRLLIAHLSLVIQLF